MDVEKTLEIIAIVPFAIAFAFIAHMAFALMLMP